MRRTLVLSAFLLPLVPPLLSGDGHDADVLTARIDAALAGAGPDLIAFRRDLHQHPELSGEEIRTAEHVAARLRQLGLEVRTGVGGHGVVALLRGGQPGPIVAFRADMDAVPSTDPDPFAFASLRAGVRHICGHDIHTTLGLALATGFAAVRRDLPGSVLFVFQPAEERATGARAMLADEVFRLAHPSAIYAVHTAPLEVGRLGTATGPMLAGRDRVQVTLAGTGDLDAAARTVGTQLRAIGTIAPAGARGPVPADFVMVELGPPRTPERERRTLVATLSIASQPARAAARRRIELMVHELSRPGVTATLNYQERVIAGVTNDSTLVTQGDAALRRVLGDTAVVSVGVVSPVFSEDFGSFQAEVPGVMYLLGVSNRARGWVGMPHSPSYMADESAITIGARALTAVLLDRLRRPR
ncbi:MAG: M20 family metallopeptidase [Gemmatimonadales bacterium]